MQNLVSGAALGLVVFLVGEFMRQRKDDRALRAGVRQVLAALAALEDLVTGFGPEPTHMGGLLQPSDGGHWLHMPSLLTVNSYHRFGPGDV